MYFLEQPRFPPFCLQMSPHPHVFPFLFLWASLIVSLAAFHLTMSAFLLWPLKANLQTCNHGIWVLNCWVFKCQLAKQQPWHWNNGIDMPLGSTNHGVAYKPPTANLLGSNHAWHLKLECACLFILRCNIANAMLFVTCHSSLSIVLTDFALYIFVCVNAKTKQATRACMDLAKCRSLNLAKCLHGSCKVKIPPILQSACMDLAKCRPTSSLQSAGPTSSLQSAGPTSSICSHHLPEAMHCQIGHWPCSNWRGHHLKVMLQSLLGRYLLSWQDLERRWLIFLSTCWLSNWLPLHLAALSIDTNCWASNSRSNNNPFFVKLCSTIC